MIPADEQTCNHLLAAEIDPTVKFRTILIQEVALEIVVVVPLRNVHVVERVIVGLGRDPSRLPRDLNFHALIRLPANSLCFLSQGNNVDDRRVMRR